MVKRFDLFIDLVIKIRRSTSLRNSVAIGGRSESGVVKRNFSRAQAGSSRYGRWRSDDGVIEAECRSPRRSVDLTERCRMIVNNRLFEWGHVLDRARCVSLRVAEWVKMEREM